MDNHDHGKKDEVPRRSSANDRMMAACYISLSRALSPPFSLYLSSSLLSVPVDSHHGASKQRRLVEQKNDNDCPREDCPREGVKNSMSSKSKGNRTRERVHHRQNFFEKCAPIRGHVPLGYLLFWRE